MLRSLTIRDEQLSAAARVLVGGVREDDATTDECERECEREEDRGGPTEGC